MREAEQQEPAHVLVLATLGAPQRRLLSAHRSRGVAPEPLPTPVATARATVIHAQPVAPAEAEAWLAAAESGSAEAALAVLARAVRAHRVASGDPAVREPALAQALVVRAGHGAGEQVAAGRWSEARELAPERRRRARRAEVLYPQERVAALLGGRSRLLACEELALRAREDLDRGHVRQGALQLRAALDAALAELPVEGDLGVGSPTLGERVEQLRARRPALDALADAALAGTLPPDGAATLAETLGRLEAALRTRLVTGR